jgi:arginyl-tRNA synthetase
VTPHKRKKEACQRASFDFSSSNRYTKGYMKQIIAQHIISALQRLLDEGQVPLFELPKIITVEPPKLPGAGDYTTNIALILAKQVKKSPQELAQLICGHLPVDTYLASAQAGYINLTFSFDFTSKELNRFLIERMVYQVSVAKKINNEFISANPTGPLHIGNGRGGYFGDSLTRLLRLVGHQVTSEYYINDGGEQITKLGHSILKDEEAVYEGEYIEELHHMFASKENNVEALGKKAAHEILEKHIKKTVGEKMGIVYDTWTSERALMESGQVEKAVNRLKENGHTYEAEGALWLRTTDFGDDKDRVLQKTDGSITYFASDAGHILGYIEQGVEVILETFGADHHGYTRRFEAVARALGFEGTIHFTLMQLVKLEKEGEEVRMSKRAGNVVTIDELVEHVGPDVARFFFLMYSPDTHMTFDLGLAEERSQKNPVFYVQYAHARMASILAKAKVAGFAPSQVVIGAEEAALARELMRVPDLLQRAAEDYAPHRLPQAAISLAQEFHSFYAKVPVINEEGKQVTEQRLALVAATQKMLATLLDLIGVTAPEKM